MRREFIKGIIGGIRGRRKYLKRNYQSLVNRRRVRNKSSRKRRKASGSPAAESELITNVKYACIRVTTNEDFKALL